MKRIKAGNFFLKMHIGEMLPLFINLLLCIIGTDSPFQLVDPVHSR